jgi:hypothetical protein
MASTKVSKKKLETVMLPSLPGCEKVKPNYEAYGRKVCAYMSTPEGMLRTAFEAALENLGCKVAKDYWPGSNRVEVENISYFKAWHWDE